MRAARVLGREPGAAVAQVLEVSGHVKAGVVLERGPVLVPPRRHHVALDVTEILGVDLSNVELVLIGNLFCRVLPRSILLSVGRH